MRISKLGFTIAAGCATCAVVACSDVDEGGLRPATRDAGDTLDASADARESGDASTSEVERWVGRVEGTDIRVGAVVDRGERARIFFCGGPSSYETATRWVAVEVGEAGSYAYEENEWRVTGRVDGASLRGEVVLGDRESARFDAAPVAPGTLAGLYEGLSDCGRLGLIVSQDEPSDEPIAQGACVGAGHLPEQVNPILPIALVDGEIRVRVGETEAQVREAGALPR